MNSVFNLSDLFLHELICNVLHKTEYEVEWFIIYHIRTIKVGECERINIMIKMSKLKWYLLIR